MKKTLFKIDLPKALQAALEQRVKDSLNAQKKTNPNEAEAWERQVETGLHALPLLQRGEFYVLRKQFEKGKAFLLPTAVKTARRLMTLRNEWQNKWGAKKS